MIRGIRRRHWSAVILAFTLAATAAACSSSGGGGNGGGKTGSQLQTIRLQLDWVLDSEFAPIFVADAKGFYKKEGIKLDIIPAGPNLQNVESVVAGGKADIGMSTFMSSTVNAAAQGTPFTVLGPFYATSPAVWMSPPDKPIKSARDFVGKRIGAPQGRQVQINAIFKINHLPAGKYTFVPTSFDATPLAHHAVDVQSGYITSEAVNYKQLTGKAPYTISYAAVGLPDPSSTFFTTPAFLSAHRKLVVGFMRATMEGILANESDPAYGAKITVDKYGKSLNLKYSEQLSMNKLYLPLYDNNVTKQHGLLYLDPSYVAGPVYRGYHAAGIKTVPVSQLLDISLQEQAAKGLKQP